MLQECNRCSEIVQNLLGFGHRNVRSVGIVSVNNIILNCLKLLHPKLSRLPKNLIELSLSEEEPCVMGHPGELMQVALNLILNALYAVQDSGSIHISTEVRGSMILVRVSDTGHGIAQENLDKLFDPFFTTKPPGQGIGIGLSTCYNIIMKHGGEITVASEEDQGRGFRSHSSGFRGVTTIMITAESIRVLVVDDEPFIRKLAERELALPGREVTTAPSAAQAIKLGRSHQYDVVLMDVRLPDGNGIRLLEHFRENLPDVEVIMITGYSEVDDAVEAMKMGAYDYVTKPFSLDRMNLLIDRAFQRRVMQARAAPAAQQQGRHDPPPDHRLLRGHAPDRIPGGQGGPHGRARIDHRGERRGQRTWWSTCCTTAAAGRTCP